MGWVGEGTPAKSGCQATLRGKQEIGTGAQGEAKVGEGTRTKFGCQTAFKGRKESSWQEKEPLPAALFLFLPVEVDPPGRGAEFKELVK